MNLLDVRIRNVRARTWLKFFAKIILVLSLAFGVLVGFVLFAGNTFSRYDCHREWRDSGMQSRYDWWVGCMVEAKPGKWIPAKSYREVP